MAVRSFVALVLMLEVTCGNILRDYNGALQYGPHELVFEDGRVVGSSGRFLSLGDDSSGRNIREYKRNRP